MGSGADRLHDVVDLIVNVQGYPRWMALIEVELMLLTALAARERLIAAGFTHLTISVSRSASVTW